MTQITVRGLSSEMERALRERSRREGVSLNKAALALLREGLGLGERKRKKQRDLSSIVGEWDEQQAEEFDEHVEVFESIDEELWR